MERADVICNAAGAGGTDFIAVPLWVSASKSANVFFFFQQIVKDTVAEPHAALNPAPEESWVKMESYCRH